MASASNLTRVPGRLYDHRHLAALQWYLGSQNVHLILNCNEAKFVAYAIGTHELYLRPNPTYYEVYHELQHLRHLRGVGYADFSRTSEALREQYVYDQLRRSNQAERDNAFQYILHKGGNPMSAPQVGFPKPDLP